MKTSDSKSFKSYIEIAFTIFILLASGIVQEGFTQNADSVSFKNLLDKEFVSQYKITFDVNTYTTSDGSVLKVGSPLVIGTPKLNESKKDNFPYTHWQLVMMIGKIKGYQEMDRANSGEKVMIEEITATSQSISKKEPRYITLLVKNQSGKRRFLTNYEDALHVGEVINPNASLTKEQAMKLMKDSKDMLDLGVITQEKYDSIKAKLTPIIMKQ